MEEERIRTALVLSGGGLKGLAHVGAWRALSEAGIRPDFIVGVSIGAFVGAAIAGGLGTEVLDETARSVRQQDIAVVDRRALLLNGVRRPGLFRNDVFRSYIERVLPWHAFFQLPVPLHVGAVSLSTGRMHWFGMGGSPADDSRRGVSVVQAVLASSALPGFYPPLLVDSEFLVDGGVVDAFPIGRAAELGADRIIGVDVTSGPEPVSAEQVVENGMLRVAERVFGIGVRLRLQESLADWDGPPLLHVRPRLAGIGGFDFDHNDEIVAEGYRSMREGLGSLAKMTGS